MLKTFPRNLSPVFSVNLLYLVTILLNITLGSWLQSVHFVWGLIASEVLLFLLPTIVFLRLRHVPLKEGFRFKPLHPLIGLLCALLGFTTYLFAVVIDAAMARLITIPGMPVSAESVIPKGTLELTGLFIALAIVVPICEETLFRGVIQTTYEKQRPVSSAIATVALMFAFWHFQVSGFWSLLLKAYILGYVAWRSGSIFASILVHFGLNASAAANLLFSLNTGKGLPFLGLPAAAAGLALTIVLVFAIRRLTAVTEHVAAEQQVQPRPRLWHYLPLAVAGLIYLAVIAQTYITGNITLSQAGYNKVQIDQEIDSRFQIMDQSGEDVGEMNCKIIPQGSNIHLDCTSNVRAYDITTGSGNFKDANHTLTWSATWNIDNMALLDYACERSSEEAASNFRAIITNGRMAVENSAGTQEMALSPDDLVEFEWAWRVNALKPQAITSIQAPFAYLQWWDEQAGTWRPALVSEVLHLTNYELLDLPAGQFQTHKASLGGQAAWYSNDHAGPVRFDDGTLIYDIEQ